MESLTVSLRMLLFSLCSTLNKCPSKGHALPAFVLYLNIFFEGSILSALSSAFYTRGNAHLHLMVTPNTTHINIHKKNIYWPSPLTTCNTQINTVVGKGKLRWMQALQYWLIQTTYMAGGSVVQCSACDLKIASSILGYGNFLVRGAALINSSRTMYMVYSHLVLEHYLITFRPLFWLIEFLSWLIEHIVLNEYVNPVGSHL